MLEMNHNLVNDPYNIADFNSFGCRNPLFCKAFKRRGRLGFNNNYFYIVKEVFIYAFSILIDVIVSEPATVLSLNILILSVSSFKANA